MYGTLEKFEVDLSRYDIYRKQTLQVLNILVYVFPWQLNKHLQEVLMLGVGACLR